MYTSIYNFMYHVCLYIYMLYMLYICYIGLYMHVFLSVYV